MYIGVATASHQNEGNNFRNNWWDWEMKAGLERSGMACNSWVEYRRDIDCVKRLGCNAYRFSIEWSRIFLSEDRIDKSALDRYKDMLEYCREVGVEPIVTLHHFTRPRWVDMKYGGLHSKHVLRLFHFYVEEVMKHMGNLMSYVVTFNEPMLECVHGYLRGTRPPGLKGDFEKLYSALENVVDCHCVAYDIIKRYNRDVKVGIVKNLVDFEVQYSYDRIKASIERQIIKNYNWGILDALYKGKFRFGVSLIGLGMKKRTNSSYWKGKIDFLGLNHYNVGYVDITYRVYDQIDVKLKMDGSGYESNCLGWDMKEVSMRNVINKARKRYGNIPIMVTESGNCGAEVGDEGLMEKVMDNHMEDVMKMDNIIGYMWWTLMDNYEWEDGRLPKFGLYYLDGEEVIMKEIGKKYGEKVKKWLQYHNGNNEGKK